MRLRRCLGLVLALAVAAGGEPGAAQEAPEVDEECTLDLPVRPAVLAPPITSPPGVMVPTGQALGALGPAQCSALLQAASIAFEPAPPTAGVAQPVRVRGEIGAGFVVRSPGPEPRPAHGRVPRAEDHRFDAIFDCRLVLAVHAWASELRAAGFVGIEHVSVLRPRARVAATGRVSGHAHALAIDVLRLVRADGTTFGILEDWIVRTHGADPCAPVAEPPEQSRVRRAVCRGVERGLFQIVITPHHDQRHANHLHLEVRPGVDWSVVR